MGKSWMLLVILILGNQTPPTEATISDIVNLLCNTTLGELDVIADPDLWIEDLMFLDFTSFCSNVELTLNITESCYMGGTDWIAGLIGLFNPSLGETIQQQSQASPAAVAVWDAFDNIDKYCGLDIGKLFGLEGLQECVNSVVDVVMNATFDTLDGTCMSYSLITVAVDACVNTSLSLLTDTEAMNAYASYYNVFQYFQSIAQNCVECSNIVYLFVSQYEGCKWAQVDYTTLQLSEYCTYLQNILSCVEETYEQCPLLSPAESFDVYAGILVYGDVFACQLELDNGINFDDLTQAEIDAVFPPCAMAGVTCLHNILDTWGVTFTSGDYGGFDFNGVGTYVEGVLIDIMQGDFDAMCQELNSTLWDVVYDCTTVIADNCPVNTGATDGVEMLISGEISYFLNTLCLTDCANVKFAGEIYNTCAEFAFVRETWDPLVEFFTVIVALFSSGGANIESCLELQEFVNCLILNFGPCDLLMGTYWSSIGLNPNLPYSIALCNINLDLTSLNAEIGENNNYPIFAISAGSRVLLPVWIGVLAVAISQRFWPLV